jgi:sodium/potassium/calcium exchanger 6
VGRLTGVHDLFLGETVLAWSASAGDLASNLAVAAAGAPATAFTGCFAGPLFNLMVRPPNPVCELSFSGNINASA